MELPGVIPLFPLPNVVLFPGVPLPLHIFEPRYRVMVEDVSQSHEIVGMVLLRGDTPGSPTTFQVGCAGRLVNREPLPDGRSNILLHGLREFRIEHEVGGKPYRQAAVTWLRREGHGLRADLRHALVDTLRTYLQRDPDSPAHRVLQEGTLSDDILVNFFSYALDVPPLEKQALLEEPSLEGRAERLCAVVDFRAAEMITATPGTTSERWH